MALPRKATLADVRGLSAGYIGRVLERMQEVDKQFGPPTVCIAIASNPKWPDYRVFAQMDKESAPINTGAFHGKSHRPLPFSQVEDDDLWSIGILTLDEVERLRQQLSSVALRR